MKVKIRFFYVLIVLFIWLAVWVYIWYDYGISSLKWELTDYKAYSKMCCEEWLKPWIDFLPWWVRPPWEYEERRGKNWENEMNF
jgi:hypothetical protein